MSVIVKWKHQEKAPVLSQGKRTRSCRLARASNGLPVGGRIAILRHVHQDVLHPAVQNLAQGVQGGGGDGLAVLHAVEGVGVNPLFKDQVVFRDPFAEKRLVKGTIADHNFITGYRLSCSIY